ncbi:MAG: hypothetical protein WC444_02365 [Candidatus Paceibacterota bacterium]
MKSMFLRAFGALVAGLALAFLVACGGGGSDTTPVTPPPTSTLVLTADTPTFVVGTSTATVTIVVNASEQLGATGGGLPIGTFAVSNKSGGLYNVSVGFYGNTRTSVKLIAGNLPTANPFDASVTLQGVSGSKTITVTFVTPSSTTCPTGTVLMEGICQPILHYADKVLALWGKTRKIYSVTPMGVELLINKSSHIEFGTCAFGQKLPNGGLLSKCTDGFTNNEFLVQVNLVTNEQFDYVGTEPAGTVWTYVQTDGSHFPTWAREAKVSDGDYYVEGASTSVIWFKTNTGVTSIVKAGNFVFDGSVAGMIGGLNN